MDKKISEIKFSSKTESKFCSLTELNIGKKEFNIDNFKSDYPYIPSLYSPLCDPDPIAYYDGLLENSVNKLITRKFYWACQTTHLSKKIIVDRKNFMKFTNNLLTKKYSKNYPHHVSRLYADFMNQINSDPDPNFNGIYNWYYTGGTTVLLNLEDQIALVKRNGPSLDSIEIIQSEDYWDFFSEKSNKIQLDLVKDEPVYQIISNEYSRSAFLGIRQKKAISVYQIKSSENCLQLKLAFRSPFIHNVTGMDFNPCVKEVTFVTTVNDEIYLYDIKANQCVIKEHFNRNPNRLFPWNWPVCLEDPHLLLLADTHNINLMDTRKGLKFPSLEDPLFCNQRQCNNFCQLICHPCNETQYYAVSRHNVYLRDIRNLSSSNSIDVWTHWLKQEPCYARHFNDFNNQGILLASQNGEVSLVLNDQVARVLPTLAESVEDQILQGNCLAPNTQLHLKQPISGLELIQQKYGGQVVIQTAPGNLFFQNLKSRNQERLEEEEEKQITHISFKEWEETSKKSKPKFELRYTSKKNVKSAFKAMKRALSNSSSSNQKEKHIRTFISKKKLLSYSDTLDTILLDVWDINEEPEWAPLYEQEPSSTHDKIADWFSKHFTSQTMEVPTLDNSFQDTTLKYNEEVIIETPNGCMASPARSNSNHSIYNLSQPTPAKRRKLDFSGYN